MSIQNLFRLDYWFSEPFTARGATLWLLVGGFLLFIVLGLVDKILSQYQQDKSKRLMLKRSGSFGITMGFLGLVWMFFRQERVAFLAWRFWMFLWVVGAAIWVYCLARYALKRIPEIKAEEAKRIALEKYLPKKN
jgi:UDP-N-acetylmuramyl pentapeptide phosphotransferase/UDP-N-acetylglucosamine-1-phosphate transferase